MADERFLAQLWAVIESRKADDTATEAEKDTVLA